MRLWLLEFLNVLEVAVPPRAGGHHAITLNRYGSDEAGWSDRLGVHVHWPEERNQTFFLDDEDFNKTPAALVAEIISFLPPQSTK